MVGGEEKGKGQVKKREGGESGLGRKGPGRGHSRQLRHGSAKNKCI